MGSTVSFLGNRTVNQLNLHYGLHALAANAGGLFFAVYLLKAGLSAPWVLVSIALILAGRFCLRPLALMAGKRWGLKPTVMMGTLAQALPYLVLPYVTGITPYWLVMCLAWALGDALYWPSYHAYFAALGDAEHRGHQVSAREALATAMGILGPILGGWALLALGAWAGFGIAAGVQLVSVLPLLSGPQVKIAAKAEGAVRAARRGFWLLAADGWLCAGWIWIWQIILFSTLSQSFTAFGGALALGAMVSALAGLVLGRFVDGGHGQRAAVLAFGVMAGAVIFRALVTTPVLSLLANALGALVVCLYTPPLMRAIYNMSQASPCPLRFHMVTEGGYDLGASLGCLVSAGLIAMGLSLPATMLLALIGAAAVMLLLRRYYGAEPRTEPHTAPA
jgi:MFS family permease